MQILNVGDRCGEAHPGDEKTTPSVWFRRKDGQPREWMVAFPSKERVGVFSGGGGGGGHVSSQRTHLSLGSCPLAWWVRLQMTLVGEGRGGRAVPGPWEESSEALPCRGSHIAVSAWAW